jgi:hypothetical protein
MAISTIGSHLMNGTGTGTLTWTELFKFKTDPTLIDAPEILDTTTQADHARTSVFGLASSEAKTFNCNYDATTYDAVKALEGQELNLSLWLGDTYDSSTNTYTPTGSYGKFTGKGYLFVSLNGGDVNTVRDMTVTLAVTVGFVKEASSALGG